MHKLLSVHPSWITLQQTHLARVVDLRGANGGIGVLPTEQAEWAAFNAMSVCECGGPLRRWRAYPAKFFTLASGMLQGSTIFFRCYPCRRVYGGNLRWDNFPEDSSFPEGYHHPICVKDSGLCRRWFYATPHIIWDTALLQWIFGSMSRGGMSMTAVWSVYASMWQTSMAGTMYAKREHFLNKLMVVVIAWSLARLFTDAGCTPPSGAWYIRPHHHSQYFQPLLQFANGAFQSLAKGTPVLVDAAGTSCDH